MRWFSGSRARKPAGSILSFLILICPARAVAQNWAVARDAHFEVYSEAGAASAREAIARFEQLRAFFLRQGLIRLKDPARQVRVIGFASEGSYAQFRLRPTADAYYAASGDQDYIVLPGLGERQFSMAAHEYAHLVLRSMKLDLPLWLNEGLAEYFSTLRITLRGTEIGGDLRARSQLLARGAWIPAAELFTANAAWLARQSREREGMFYAESWSITDLLLSSPAYRPRFGELLQRLNGQAKNAEVLAEIYAISFQQLSEQARAHKPQAEMLPAVEVMAPRLTVADVSDHERQFVLADLLAAVGELVRAQQTYTDLLRLNPDDANVYAALGTVALRCNNRTEALRDWQIAVQKGVRDAELCYQYAVLANAQNVPANEIRPALERAVALRPDFDDARYALALLESNAGDFTAALAQFHAMRPPAPARAFAYWRAVAYAATEANEREEAEGAARRAFDFAHTPEERAQALEADYIARTDLMVHFERGADGQTRLVTTRVPHGSSDFNPFIEPQDQVRRADGNLREVKCEAGRLTGFVLATAEGSLAVKVPDPSRVLMRNSPSEFTCGPQTQQRVRIEYAAQGNVLRGMEFR